MEDRRVDDARFRVAAANLTFHQMSDTRIRVDCGDSGCRIALQTLSIDPIARERIRDQKICCDRPYYRWRIALNSPQGGAITFGASGFTQVLRAEPVLLDQQQLPPATACRSGLPGRRSGRLCCCRMPHSREYRRRLAHDLGALAEPIRIETAGSPHPTARGPASSLTAPVLAAHAVDA